MILPLCIVITLVLTAIRSAAVIPMQVSPGDIINLFKNSENNKCSICSNPLIVDELKYEELTRCSDDNKIFHRKCAELKSVVSLVDVNKMLEDIKCSICHDVLFRSDSEELIKCTGSDRHIFHCECAFQWYLDKLTCLTCPECRAEWSGAFKNF